MEPANKQQLLEIKMDMKLLLECLDYQKDNPPSMKQALVTLSAILQGSGEAKDMFREAGGLQSVLDIVTSSRHGEVTEAGLYCLGSATERNAHSQKLLSTASTFTFLHGIMAGKHAEVRKKQTAAFLILCLVSNNGFGQNLARQSSCLQDVISLIRTCLPTSVGDCTSDWLETADGTSLQLWSTLVSTASVCVNNPINDANQRICASLLPYLFSLLQDEVDHQVGRPILSLVGLTVANNVHNQDRVRKCGGLDIFVRLLKQLVKKMDDDHNKKSLAVQLLSTLDACISENEESSRVFGRLGAIRPLMAMLSSASMDDQDKTQVVLILAHAVDIFAGNRHILLEDNGMTSLIQQLTLTEDEELSKTIKYLLHMCLPAGNQHDDNCATDAEILSDKMEEMKRHSELQMLKKIGELDKKLESMQREATERAAQIEQLESSSCCMTPQRQQPGAGIARLDREPLTKARDRDSQSCHMTPREKSLLNQLQKEQAERQRLEALNQMLHKDIHTGCISATDSVSNPAQGGMLPPQYRDMSRNGVNQYELVNRKDTLVTDVPMIVTNNQEVQLISNKGDGDIQHRLSNNDMPQHASGYATQIEHVQIPHQGTIASYLSNVNACKKSNFNSSEQTGFAQGVVNQPSLPHDNSVIMNKSDIYTAQKLHGYAPLNNGNVTMQHLQSDQRQSRNDESESSAIKAVTVDVMKPLYQDDNICVLSRKQVPDNGQNEKQLESSLCVTSEHKEMLSVSGVEVKSTSGNRFSTCYPNTSSDVSVNMQKKPVVSSSCTFTGHVVPQCNMTQPANIGSQADVGNTVHTKPESDINQAVCKVCLDVVNVQSNDSEGEKPEETCNILSMCQEIGTSRENVGANPPGNRSQFTGKSLNTTATSTPKSETILSPQSVRKRILFDYETAVTKSKQNKQTVKKYQRSNSDISDNSSKFNYPQVGMTPAVQVDDVTKSPYSVINVPLKHKSNDNVNKSADTCIKIKENKGAAATAKCLDKGDVTPKPSNQTILSKANCSKDNETTPCKKTTDVFIKPSGAPRKSKIRITPLLGSNKMPKPNLLKLNSSPYSDIAYDVKSNISVRSSSSRYDSDMDDDTQSVFDLQLVQNLNNNMKTAVHSINDNKTTQAGTHKETFNIKYQNSNTAGNLVYGWSVLPTTPQKQACVPMRPAFSDCGSRRPVPQSPFSVKSVGRIRKHTLNDSGIYSPGPLITLSPGNSSCSDSFGSLRSSSDVSNEGTQIDGEHLQQRGGGKKIFTMQPNCPACHSSYKGEGRQMNSRTYNIVLETDPGTCGYHRQLRRLERIYIHRRKKQCALTQAGGRLLSKLPFARRSERNKDNRKSADRVYDFTSESESDDESQPVCNPARAKRRKRVPYTDNEERALIEGVTKLGRFWTQILLTYDFHPSRTAVDLTDKYKRMQALEKKENDPKDTASSCGSRNFKPFSMCEERRLRRGIKQFGYNWRTILRSFTFCKGRTTDDLRNRWRCMHKNSSARQ